MIPTFSLAALCCIPIHNPGQRQKEREIMKWPAQRQLAESWEATFPEAASQDQRVHERVRDFRVIRSIT